MNRNEKRKVIYCLSLITQIGITMIVPIFICLYLGIKISRHFDKDYIVIIALIFGMTVSFRNAHQLTRKMYIGAQKKEHEKQKYFDDLRKAREENIRLKALSQNISNNNKELNDNKDL